MGSFAPPRSPEEWAVSSAFVSQGHPSVDEALWRFTHLAAPRIGDGEKRRGRIPFNDLAEKGWKGHTQVAMLTCVDANSGACPTFRFNPGDAVVCQIPGSLLIPYGQGTANAAWSTIELIDDAEISEVIMMPHRGCAALRGIYEMSQGRPPARRHVRESYEQALPFAHKVIKDFERLNGRSPNADEACARLEVAAVAESVRNLQDYNRSEGRNLNPRGWFYDFPNLRISALQPDMETLSPITLLPPPAMLPALKTGVQDTGAYKRLGHRCKSAESCCLAK